jgi:hypothetical protein
MTCCGRLVDVTPVTPATSATPDDTVLAHLCANFLSRWQGELLGGTSSWFICDLCANTCNAPVEADRYYQYKGNVNRCTRCVKHTSSPGLPAGEVQDLGAPVGVFLDSMGDTEYVGVWGLDVSPTFHKPMWPEDFQDTLLALGSLNAWRCVWKQESTPGTQSWLFERQGPALTPAPASSASSAATALFGVMNEEQGECFHLYRLPQRFASCADALADYDINHIGFESFEEWMLALM